MGATFRPLLQALALLALTLPALAGEQSLQARSQSETSGRLAAGPNSTEGQLEEDARSREVVVGVPWLDNALGPYFDWKGRVQDRVGLRFGSDYTALYQGATSSPGEQQGAAGMWRFFGSWELLDREGDFTGSLVFKGENRHAMGTEITPMDLGIVTGSALPTGVPFGDADWLLTNLFWKQQVTGPRDTDDRSGGPDRLPRCLRSGQSLGRLYEPRVSHEPDHSRAQPGPWCCSGCPADRPLLSGVGFQRPERERQRALR